MTGAQHPVPQRQILAGRERVIDTLCTHFAYDHLDEGELERRLDLAHQATSLAELNVLLADLPELAESTSPATQAHEMTGPPAAQVRDRQVVAAIMGGAERKGTWTPARKVFAIAWMGGVALDFREAHFGPGVTTVDVLAIMGGVEILVPPGLRVESDGIGIMGGFEGRDQSGASSHPDAPILRINGLALMGGVEITERLPGESARDAKHRRRDERKARRLQHND
jgi:hypothetical protein